MSTNEDKKCEQCGEQPQEISLAHAGLCFDCAGDAFSEILTEDLGYKPCGTIVTLGRSLCICIEKHGVEHDHNDIELSFAEEVINIMGDDEWNSDTTQAIAEAADRLGIELSSDEDEEFHDFQDHRAATLWRDANREGWDVVPVPISDEKNIYRVQPPTNLIPT